MPPSLRKVCHACAIAKRRCTPQLPQCSRCAARGLHCIYDLEPVTNVGPLPIVFGPPESQPPVFFDSVSAAHKAAVESYSPGRRDNLPVMANPEILLLVTERFLRPIPQLTFQRQTTPYVHGRVLQTCCADLPGRNPGTDVLGNLQEQLMSLQLQSLSFAEFLAAFHNLIAVLLALFLEAAHQPMIPSKLLALWFEWREHLRTKLPQTLSGELSAWQAWYTAESARRSLLSVILVDGILEVLQKGYCTYRPMVESLPFDARTGLWEADTEREWLRAVAQHGGIQSSLISWSEFIEKGGHSPRKQFDGSLQRLLLVVHFGKAAADLQNET